MKTEADRKVNNFVQRHRAQSKQILPVTWYVLSRIIRVLQVPNYRDPVKRRKTLISGVIPVKELPVLTP